MILFKTALHNLKKNIVMNLFIILQIAVSLVITAIMISSILIRAQYYTPIRDIITSNGLFLKYTSLPNYDTTQMNIYDYLDSDDIRKECPDADHVYACHTLFGEIKDFKDGENLSFQSYEDEFLNRYQPELSEGRWLTTTCESNQIELVVSENDYGVKVGDTISFRAWNYPEGVDFTGKVVGIFKDNAKIIGGYLYDDGSTKMNHNSLYYPFNHKIEDQIMILASYTAVKNITSNFQLQFDTDYVVQPIISSVIITYPDSVSPNQIKEDQEKLLQYGYANTESLDQLNKNSVSYLLEKTAIFLPIVIILFMLASVSTISSSALIVRKSLRNYAIYYINGLQWKQCCLGNLIYAAALLVISVILGLGLLLVIPFTVLSESVKIIWSPYIILAFILIIVMQLIISMIMPMIIIGRSTPKQILTR